MIRKNLSEQKNKNQKFRLQNMNDDESQQLARIIQRFQRQVNQLRQTTVALTMEMAQLQSMHNRTVRDLIATRQRVLELERIAAYRTKFSDAQDPLKIQSERSSEL